MQKPPDLVQQQEISALSMAELEGHASQTDAWSSGNTQDLRISANDK
jgi:hypothetical protein